MSHYSSLKTKIKNGGALKKALQSINNGKWKNCIEVHEKATNLYGYHGDKREQTANIIIRRKDIGSSSNDIGFVRQPDGTYQAIISDFDSRQFTSDWLNQLNQLYSLEVVRETAKNNGFSFEFTEVNGEIHVTCEKD